MRRRTQVLIGLLLCSSVLAGFFAWGRAIWGPWYDHWRGRRTTAEVIATLAPRLRPDLQDACAGQGLPYPPPKLALLADKGTAQLAVWAGDADGWRRLVTHPILGTSGGPGPKRREGDGQIPEGCYRIDALNPNSAFHLSLRIDYPNAADLAHAAEEGRDDPGSDIFIHGADVSVGCLAMGDPVIEEIFLLVHDTGLDRVAVIISPSDPRVAPLRAPAGEAAWVGERYAEIEAAWLRITGTRVVKE